MRRNGSLAWMAAALAAALPVIASAAGPVAGGGEEALRQLREERRRIAHRPRGILFNNDGCDVLYFPPDLAPTVSNFLARRTAPLAGTQVGAIAYCSISSGFGFFTHDTKAGTVMDRTPGDYGLQPGKRNITRDLIGAGSDCLAAVTAFAHSNRMECFWSMRMNDTHDAAHRPDKPFLLYPKLKEDHPDWLVGDGTNRTPHGRWSSVDYARPEVRDLAFRYIEEVCRGYDVDGIELDFFRHLCFFRSTATGGVAGQAERDMMTGFLRRVRAMTETEGLRRGRPILVLLRTPDSAGFCRDMGLDLEAWLREGLADLLATTCYFRLNPWETSVALGHAHDVPVYPCLSDSRVKGETRFRRSSVEAYRGRALAAWAAGADGIHVFNHFDVDGPRSPVFRELGDPEALRRRERLYFVTVRDGKPEAWLAGGSRHRTVSVLAPSAPVAFSAGKPLRVELPAGETPSSAGASRATLHVRLGGHGDAPPVSGTFNGRALPPGSVTNDWCDFPIEPAWIRSGANLVELIPAAGEDGWTASYEPGVRAGSGWTADSGSSRTDVRPEGHALLIADRGTNSGDYVYLRHPWAADPGTEAVIEARVRVVSGLVRVIFANGSASERLDLRPDGIRLWSRASARHAMDTTDSFHDYRIELRGKVLRVLVDGKARIEVSEGWGRDAAGRNEVCFGAADSPSMGEALWELVRVRSGGLVCRDMVLRVAPPGP